MDIICELCKKSVGHATSLKRHQGTKICQNVRDMIKSLRKDDKTIIDTLTARVDELERESLLKNEQIRQLKNQLENAKAQATLETKLELAQVAIEKTEERASRLEQHILRENSKPRSSGNITMNLAPLCSQDELEKICAGYTVDHFNGGPEATYQFLLKNCLTDSEGNPRIKCTDTSRRVFKGRSSTGEPFVDVGGKKIAKNVSKPIKSAIRTASNQIDDIEEYSITTKASSHYRSIEPARLSRRLAQDLNI